jgi:hypothetical protein
MKQIIEQNMKRYIRNQIEENGKCNFDCLINDDKYCHFLANPECGYYSEMHTFDFPQRQEFYRCRFPKQLEFKW